MAEGSHGELGEAAGGSAVPASPAGARPGRFPAGSAPRALSGGGPPGKAAADGDDLEADGYAEIASGPGPSLRFGPNLRVFDYDGVQVTGKPGADLWPFGGRYGLLVGTGDITGNGKAEVLASAGPDPSSPSDVRIFKYRTKLVSVARLTPFATFFGGSHVTAGDVTLDGKDELCVTPGFLSPNTGLLKVYQPSLSGFVPIPELDQPVFPGFGYGATCAIGNVGI